MPTYLRHSVLALATSSIALAGCAGPKTPDSHREVFTSMQEAGTKRLAEQQEETKDLALDILKFERPDITPTKGADGVINLQADGQQKALDLRPLQTALLAEGSKKRDILLTFFAQHLPAFDQDRLRTMGFERAKRLLVPHLVSRDELRDLSQPLGTAAALHTVNVIGDLQWMPMVQFGPGTPAQPISSQVLAAWKVEWPAVDRAAFDNLRPQLTEANLLTTSFVPMGRAGGIAPGTNPAIILLPEFLPAVQKAWQSDDNLVILAGSPRDVRFIEQHNERLLAVLYPGWQSRTKSLRDPLSVLPLLLDNKGYSVFDYTPPASKPSTQSAPTPASKPIFIVR